MSTDPTQGGTLPPIPTRAELEAAGIRIALGIPLGHAVSDVPFLHLWEVARRGWPLIQSRPYGRVDVHRNEFARALLETDYTHLAMLDTDQVHPPDVIEHLARWMLAEPKIRVVSGFHFRRGEPYDPLAFRYDPEKRGYLPPVHWGLGLAPFDAVGHGSTIIHRSVFEQLEWPYWAYSYSPESVGKYPSEDMYFSAKLRQAGIDIWVDTTQTSPHLTHWGIDERTFRDYLAAHPELVEVVEVETEDDEGDGERLHDRGAAQSSAA